MSEERVVTLISPKKLADYVTSNEKVLVIDVRDSDYNDGGHIKGSRNIPSFLFNASTVKDILDLSLEDKYETILFYCAYGQQRSVKCANTMNSYINRLDNKPLIQISFLEGGFMSFQRTKGCEALIEK